MGLKIITQIKRWLEQECPEEIRVEEQKELPNGIYYDFYKDQFRFCLVLQDYKQGPKVNWIFHREFTKDEKLYWEGRYDFKLHNENNITKSTLQIQDIHNKDDVKVLMSRTIPTLRVFKKDLRWIIIMAKQEVKR